jgi:DNA gyrase subunit A
MTTREGDIVENMFTCSSHDYVLMFSNLGRLYRIKAYEIPEGSRTSKGMNLINILPLMSGEKIINILPLDNKIDLENPFYVCMITKNGTIKRTSIEAFKNVRKTGIIAINIDENDELAYVCRTTGDEELMVATKKGFSIRFNENQAREMGRTARGVRAIRLREGDEVIGMLVCKEGKEILTVTETGYGRISSFDDYRTQTRGGKGLTNYRTAKYGDVAEIVAVDNDDDIIMITSSGIIIRVPVEEISRFSRPAKGVRVMRVRTEQGEKILSIATATHDSEEVTDHPEAAEADAGDVGGPDEVEDNDTDIEETIEE